LAADRQAVFVSGKHLDVPRAGAILVDSDGIQSSRDEYPAPR
jgi:hypothetical protein